MDPSAESKPGACREQLAIHERSLAVLEGHESHRQEEREQLPSTIAELAQDTEDHTTPEETVENETVDSTSTSSTSTSTTTTVIEEETIVDEYGIELIEMESEMKDQFEELDKE